MDKTSKIAWLEEALENAKRVNSEQAAMLLEKDEIISAKNSELAKKDENNILKTLAEICHIDISSNTT